MYRRHLSSLFVIIALGLNCLQSQVSADTPINSIQDLRNIQTKVNTLVKSVLPATVSLSSLEIGASGSGVIINQEGLILTAAHVVQNSTEMVVVFPNGQQANAKVLGAHFTRDSAMLQITDKAPTDGWPYAEIGSSKNLSTGDFVIAMGHPGGYDPTRTPPVRFGRFVGNALDHFFNTDCSIIGGDSGGPLFDLDGKVIGIHSSIGNSLSANNHASIEGFKQDWERLQQGEQWGKLGHSGLHDVDSPVLGILTERISRNGLLVAKVVPQGPADKAGLREGDIIQTLNNKETSMLNFLQIELSKHKAGDNIDIEILRNQKTIQLTITLGSRGDVFNLLNR